jgi:hypothetical protein
MVTNQSIQLNFVLFEFIKEIFSRQEKRIEVDELASIEQVTHLNYYLNIVFDKIRKKYLIIKLLKVFVKV